MNLKEIKSAGKNALKGNYLKYFILSFIAFLLSFEIILDFTEKANWLNIVKISYFMVFVGILLRPVYVFYLKNVYLSSSFISIKECVKKEYINKITAVFFIRRIIILLSFLLFIIPGIYNSLKYMFVPYILAEAPDMKIQDIFRKSAMLTKGNKLLLIKFISGFALWYILGFLCFIIGIVFVNTYFEMSLKNLYLKLKEDL